MKSFDESLIQSIPTGLMILNQDNEVEYINRAGEEILQIKSDEIVGKALDSIILTTNSKSILDFKPGGDYFNFNKEIMVLAPNQRKIPLGFSIATISQKQRKFKGKAVHFQDLSEIKKMHEEMLLMDRMASLSKMFIGIAHEIRNPLAGIKTTAQALGEEIDEEDPKREYLERIIREIDRLNELLKSFFSFARPQRPMITTFDLKDLLNEVLFILNRRLKIRKIDLIKSIDEHLPKIKGDFNQIKQVILNLLLNSIQAIPGSGGQIRITAIRTAKNSHTGEGIRISVSDTGQGISAEHLDRVFDPFFTTRAQGTGMGLSICYRIIQEHKGNITVDSKPGKGTLVSIFLPL